MAVAEDSRGEAMAPGLCAAPVRSRNIWDREDLTQSKQTAVEGKGKVRASACMRWDTWLAERKLRGTAQGGRTTPPPARLNTIFRALKRTESAMEEETR